MIRFGASHINSKRMDENQIFLVRLHLLIVMVKAKLKGYPGGDHRDKAVLKNAAIVYRSLSGLNFSFLGSNSSPHIYQERIKLLCVMATAIVSEDYPLGNLRREAVNDNIEIIVKTIFPKQKLSLFHDVLMSA
jgi:hypothetical protein